MQTKFLVENMKVRDHLGALCVDGRKLKTDLKGIGFIWLKTGISGVLLRTPQ
jgi:hypothetical protein